ncbi:MAG: phosphate acetyltransferase [Rubritalea sp.]|jgi:phosphate acetyltransferase
MIEKTHLNESSKTNDSFISRLYDSLKRHPKRIVFTEGEDVRVLEAAARLVKEQVIAPILLGDKARIKVLAEKNNIDISLINILDPKTASDLPLFCKRLENIGKYQRKVVTDPEELISRPHNFAAMMLQYGQADGIVSGNKSHPTSIARAATNFLKPLAHVPKIFSAVAMTAPHIENFGKEGLIILADCGVNPEPDVAELAAIAIETGKLAHHLLGRTPRVAMLSHSTRGSMITPSSQKMKAATVLARDIIAREYLEIEVDGELQADVALDTAAAKIKLNDTRAHHSADVLIFPNLDASHIAYKLLQHVAGANCYGQLIMGLTRHAAQVPMTATVDMIAGTAALVACESIKYRQLNPDEEV